MHEPPPAQPEWKGVTLKELKVILPVEYHITLRRMKILTQRSIQDIVATALSNYFEEVEAAGALDESGATPATTKPGASSGGERNATAAASRAR